MADNIPSLDSTNVSWVAYYNIFDNTSASSINPELINNASPVYDMTGYDDGVVAKYSDRHRNYTVRASTEGWITAHMDRTESYEIQQDSRSGIDGVHDIADWSRPNQISSINNNTLERAINICLQQLDIWSTIDSEYAASDVGLYNYQYPSENVSLFSDTQDGSQYGTGHRVSFQFSETTNIESAVACATADAHSKVRVTYDNTGLNILNSDPNGSPIYGAADITNDLPVGEECSISTSFDSYGDAAVHAIIIWS